MERIYLIKLTLGLYKVTNLFPPKEPMKFSLREKANEIFADSILFFSDNAVDLIDDDKTIISNRLLKNIEIIEGYFEIAAPQQWVDERNFIVLRTEYDNLKNKVLEKMSFLTEEADSVEKKGPGVSKKEESVREESQSGRRKELSERCRKIIEILEQKEKTQVWELMRLFPGLSKRTLRRDFDELLNLGLVERVGEGKFTFYRIKKEKNDETKGKNDIIKIEEKERSLLTLDNI